MDRDLSWSQISGVILVLALAQIYVGYFSVSGPVRIFQISKFFISYQLATTILAIFVSSYVIVALSGMMSEKSNFKNVLQGITLKFPIILAIFVFIFILKHTFIGFIYILPNKMGEVVAWTVLGAMFQANELVRNLDRALSPYGIWKISSVAVLVQLVIVSKYALKSNIYMAIATVVAAAISCAAVAALVFFLLYHSLYLKPVVGTLFS
ncbi:MULTISPECIES: hypothetical protein [Mesorhizobium]|uniref:Uncharacterized protein n=2 Tax=Mesorhizobium TaxID=68287 RepID=A0A1A5J5H1_RHILI|nr:MULTISPECIES: hypothetical protein [Mesorhizobium]MBE1709727.1 hypothetical protein [Mesorhizobium japonicum]MBE1714396.1 hypothetical protein [Mesorhizobium japonicum]MUT22009.1 hypothetical protein [Mesorhizobium japonicum]MUT28570.1 hypothetical protein [Mesorhizobium japonicum]OBP70762.1 hypothetical protein BAE41_18035 [Mesorhizobium loti]